jgi:hypothetical protein
MGQPPFPGPPPASNKKPLFITLGVVLAVVIACCGCLGIRFLTGDDKDPVKQASETLAVPTKAAGPTGAAPLTPEAYQAALTLADSSVAGAYAQLAKASGTSAVNAAADQLLGALDKAQLILRPLVTPFGALDREHETLMSSLSALRSEVQTARSGKSACPGAAVLPAIRNTSAADQVRKAARDLATADSAHAYKVATWLPGAAKARTLSNGTYIKRASGGPSRLKITNNSDPGTISLVKKGSKSASIVVYLGPRKKFTVNGVPSGTYTIYMASGSDWDKAAKSFSRNCSYQKFDDKFTFSSTTAWQITLTKSVGGNASTSDVPPGTFPH